MMTQTYAHGTRKDPLNATEIQVGNSLRISIYTWLYYPSLLEKIQSSSALH